jgi:energy-coupling factor transport system ATP-binding protein
LLIDGRPQGYKPAPLRELRRRVGLVFQLPEAQIFEPTVFEEVAFAGRQWGIPESEIPQRVNQALRSVGLDPESFLLRNPARISGGEARLLTIASLLVADPDWLILDEPTLGLDYHHVLKVRALMAARQQENRGVLLITHDLELAYQVCAAVIVLNEGRIAYQGPVESLFLQHDLKGEFGLTLPSRFEILKKLKAAMPDEEIGAAELGTAWPNLTSAQKAKMQQVLFNYLAKRFDREVRA